MIDNEMTTHISYANFGRPGSLQGLKIEAKLKDTYIIIKIAELAPCTSDKGFRSVSKVIVLLQLPFDEHEIKK